MRNDRPCQATRRLLLRLAVIAGLLLAAAPAPAAAQLFFATRPNPEFRIGPLFVRAAVTPALGDVVVDVLFTVAVPPTQSAVGLEQDLFFVWPGAVTGESDLGPPEPALARFVEAQGFSVIDQGRLPLFARHLYQVSGEGELSTGQAILVSGGAPYVTFVGTSGAQGLTAPATWVRIPWTPQVVNRVWLIDLRLTAQGLIKTKPATWVERVLWGARHRITLGFNDVRHGAVFPLYFWNRDRRIRLSEDPSQLVINFSAADRLRIEEMAPPSAGRRLSQSLDNTEVVSVFLDYEEGLSPQVLNLQFGYLTGVQAWAPILIPVLFFVLGNVAAVIVRGLAERAGRVLSSRVHVGPAEPGRQSGVLIPRETLARIIPGETTYSELTRLIGGPPEEHERLDDPEGKTLIFRGRRTVPHRRRTFGWLATVKSWDVEDHEVEIALRDGVVRDVQARVRRRHPTHPQSG
ncbi:MAG TPA: hypothetical protein VFR64_06280 [Methylomirabilota bacterium]|nr:hypothetical protein [Methylomirabilota bacterium]